MLAVNQPHCRSDCILLVHCLHQVFAQAVFLRLWDLQAPKTCLVNLILAPILPVHQVYSMGAKIKNRNILHHSVQEKLQRSGLPLSYTARVLKINKSNNTFLKKAILQFLNYIYMSNKPLT